ncbi:MAG: GHKL domain-containing protein, partial [Chitinophagaceae bacterium]
IQEKHGMIEAEKLPVVHAVPLQMNQLFSNILSNALKYSEKAPCIRITCRVVQAKQMINISSNLLQPQYYEITFIDNGIGFEQQYEKIIFAMFQRLHARNEYSGTGIGLALCKKIMDSHQGFITAASKPGEGSSFHIYFPTEQ